MNNQLDARESATTADNRGGIAGWLRRFLSSAIVLVLLGGVAVWGFQTDWRFVKPSARDASNAGWDALHDLSQSECIECNPNLLPRLPEHGWCSRHGIFDCPLDHPEIAEVEKTPVITDAELQRVDRALRLRPRPANNPKSHVHDGRVQFASDEAAERAGVAILPVLTGSFTETIAANGEVNYDQTRLAPLSARVAGRVWKVFKNVGDKVRRGDVLTIIDAPDVGKAKSEFLQALVRSRQRSRALADLKSAAQIVPAQVREAEAAAREAEIKLLSAEQALINLGLPVHAKDFGNDAIEQASRRVRLAGLPPSIREKLDPETAPANLLPVVSSLDGEVLACDVVAGESVVAGGVLFTVADISRFWLTLHFAPEDARFLALGQTVRFKPDAVASEIESKLTWIAASADDKTRRIAARAELANEDRTVRAGVLGAGRVLLREDPEAIVIPAEAVQLVDGSHVVFVRDKNYLKPGAPKVFHARSVRIGAKTGTDIEIIAGLMPGEVIATKGSDLLMKKLLTNMQAQRPR
jgi:cobalt-zinc-cadmium efflux system membrane fusion protein